MWRWLREGPAVSTCRRLSGEQVGDASYWLFLFAFAWAVRAAVLLAVLTILAVLALLTASDSSDALGTLLVGVAAVIGLMMFCFLALGMSTLAHATQDPIDHAQFTWSAGRHVAVIYAAFEAAFGK